MTLRKRLGSYELIQNWYTLSGSIINEVFKTIVEHIPRDHAVKQILLLGLGAGGSIQEIRKRFPNAYITAVDYDPEMVTLAKFCWPEKSYWHSVEIVTGDARHVLETSQKTFDLILIDLFVGDKVAPIEEYEQFVSCLPARLKRDGYLGINFFRQKEYGGSVFDQFLSRWANLQFENNHMAIYRPFGNGKAGDPVPAGFFDKNQSLEFLQTVTARNPSLEIVGGPDQYGLRGYIRPLCVEWYFSEAEPIIETQPFFRLIHWQPLAVLRRSGWFHNPFFGEHSQIGVVMFHDENYFKDWPRHAKRHREHWLRHTPYEIVEVTLEDFAEAYHASGKRDLRSRTEWIQTLTDHVDWQKQDVHFFAARDQVNQEIIAGLAIVDYPDIQQSVHVVSFIHAKAEDTSVGTGLIDHSFKHGLKNGIRCMNFGVFWKNGDPKSWKNYSRFKMQFNPHLIVYPPPLYKIVWPSFRARRPS